MLLVGLVGLVVEPVVLVAIDYVIILVVVGFEWGSFSATRL